MQRFQPAGSQMLRHNPGMQETKQELTLWNREDVTNEEEEAEASQDKRTLSETDLNGNVFYFERHIFVT